MFTLVLFLSTILTTTAAATAQPYNGTDNILVNCGSHSITKSFEGRIWEPDIGAQSNFTPVNSQSISNESTPFARTSSTPSARTSLVDPVPYMTARIFQHSPFTYTFPVSFSPKFLRLYLYPATYSDLQKFDSFFSVTAGDYTLLKNFGAFVTVPDINLKNPDNFINGKKEI